MSKKNAPTLGQWLASARQRRKLSRTMVAEKMGVSYAAVAFWETDYARPRADNLAKLCKLLRASVKEAEAIAA